MTSGFGVDPTLDGSGAVISGTSSQDIRSIFGGLFTPGLVSGGAVTTSASAMTYTVAPGVCIIPTATGQNVPAPIPAGTLTVASGPVSGSRVDIVYAQQRFPSIEGDSEVSLGIGTTLPPRAVQLNTYTVPAGVTNTNAATSSNSINYSIPYGATLGRLHYYQMAWNGGLYNDLHRYGYGTITLPTDRRVKFTIRAVLYSPGASGFDNSKYCEWYFLPNYDNGDFVIWTTGGLHQAWQTFIFEQEVTLPAGTHTVNFGTGRKVGPGTANTFFGTDGQGFGRNGIEFIVEDAGVAV